MNPKEILLKNKDLREKLSAVVHADWFAEALMYVWAEAAPNLGSADLTKGARIFQDTLLTLPDDEPVRPERIKSGIKHDFDVVKEDKETKPNPS